MGPNGDRKPLDSSSGHLVSVLVARGGHPIPPAELAYEVGVSSSALKNWVSRRRQTLGADVFPRVARGAAGYRLGTERHLVDAWWLLDLVDSELEEATDQQLLAVLTHGEPFPGIPDTDTDLLSSARREIRQAQRGLALRVVEADRRIVMAGMVDLVEGLLDDDPYDEELSECNARLRSTLFGRRHGLEAIHKTRLQLLESGLSPSQSLANLEASLLDDLTPGLEPAPPSTEAVSPAPTMPPSAGLPESLERLRDTPFARPNTAVSKNVHALHAGWIAVPGPSGAGKTRFVAESAAAAVAAGSTVIHMEPFRFGPEPWFRFFADAFPDVGDLVQELTEARADIAAFRHSVVLALQSNLRDMASAGPLAVVISKAHRLESEAIEALWYLVRSPMPDNLTVLIAGDTFEPGRAAVSPGAGAEVSAAWESFVDGLVASGMGTAIELDPLNPEQVDWLIRRHHPTVGRNRSMLLARKITESAGGLPGLALPLVRNLDSGTNNAIDGEEATDDLLRRLVASMPEQVQTVGAAAAVFGLRFSADEVSVLTLLPRAEVIEHLTVLYRNDLIVIEPPIGHYRFTTAQAANALLGTTPPEQHLIWHQRAAELLRSDPVRRAPHVVATSTGPEAIQAVIDAAEANVVRGQHHEAIIEYERAIQLHSGELFPRNCVGFVRALDLSGRHAEAENVRSAALERALAAGDHAAGLAVLLASWPEAEAFAEPDQMVAQLDAIDPEELAADERILYACHWSRHLSLAGRSEDALKAIGHAELMATTPTERVDLALATRYAESSRQGPEICLELLDQVRPVLGSVDRARHADLLAHQAVDAYELGSSERFETVRDELWAVVDQAGPLRRWHALLLDSVRAADFDDEAAAAVHRQGAFDHAIGHGMRHAIGVKLASDLVEQWLLGLPLATAQELGADQVSALEKNPPLLEAGMAVVMDVSGERERALALAESVAEAALARQNRRSAPSVALIASILARTKRDQLRTAARDLLLLRGDSMLLIGAFVAGLGPATRYAEHLETSRSNRADLRRRARELAEKTGSARWLRLTESSG